MSQDNKKSMVMYQGDGSNNVFAVPMTKGKYGTISVAFVRRGLDNYEYNPTTWTLNDENTLLTWTGDVLNVGDYIVIERTTARKQPYEFPNNQKHIERSDDNLERQIQEVADAADRALKLDPTYSIDSDKMNPIEWLQTIVRCKDLTVRGLRFANNVLQYSKDDPEKPESEKTWYSLLDTDGITNVRERYDVGTDTYYFEYSTDGGSNWKDVGEMIRHNRLQGRDEADCHPISAITGLQDKLDEKATGSDTYTKTEVDEKLNLKADKARTLQGYGITDAYTKAETDNKLSEKLNTESAEETYATKTELSSHTENTDNPHNVTKAQVGLGNVDNTSDANKPISTATQNALNGKLSIKQNPQDAGKVVKVGSDGNLEFTSESSGGGLLSVSHGATLKGAGTDSQPLDVADGAIGNTQLAEEVKQEIAGKQPAGNYATESDIDTLQGQIDDNSKDIEALQGAGGALTAYNFNTATPTQETLTKYAVDQIWPGNTNWAWNAANPAASTFTSADGVSRTAAEIFNSTWVNNTYDDHRWQLTNTQNTTPKVFEWADVGRDIVSVATATTAGIVRVGSGSQMVVNPTTGDISLNGAKAAAIRTTIGTPGLSTENEYTDNAIYPLQKGIILQGANGEKYTIRTDVSTPSGFIIHEGESSANTILSFQPSVQNTITIGNISYKIKAGSSAPLTSNDKTVATTEWVRDIIAEQMRGDFVQYWDSGNATDHSHAAPGVARPASGTWYRLYKSGWVEQGGYVGSRNNDCELVTLPISMSNTSFTALASGNTAGVAANYNGVVCEIRSTQLAICTSGQQSKGCSWRVEGYAREGVSLFAYKATDGTVYYVGEIGIFDIDELILYLQDNETNFLMQKNSSGGFDYVDYLPPIGITTSVLTIMLSTGGEIDCSRSPADDTLYYGK